MMEVKKVAKEQKIQDEEKKAVKFEKKTKKLVSPKFHKQIHIFRKKASEEMLMKKMWDHIIEVMKELVLRKRKIYLLFREKREEIYKFIDKQLRKRYRYIRLLKLPQMIPVFLVEKKNNKKRIFQD